MDKRKIIITIILTIIIIIFVSLLSFLLNENKPTTYEAGSVITTSDDYINNISDFENTLSPDEESLSDDSLIYIENYYLLQNLNIPFKELYAFRYVVLEYVQNETQDFTSEVSVIIDENSFSKSEHFYFFSIQVKNETDYFIDCKYFIDEKKYILETRK